MTDYCFLQGGNGSPFPSGYVLVKGHGTDDDHMDCIKRYRTVYPPVIENITPCVAVVSDEMFKTIKPKLKCRGTIE